MFRILKKNNLGVIKIRDAITSILIFVILISSNICSFFKILLWRIDKTLFNTRNKYANTFFRIEPHPPSLNNIANLLRSVKNRNWGDHSLEVPQ